MYLLAAKVEQLQLVSESPALILKFRLRCQWFGVSRLGSRLCWQADLKWFNNWRCSQHTSADQIHIPCVPVTASPGLKPKGRLLGHSQIGQAWLELQRANKYSDTRNEDPGVPTTHETSPCSCECRHKHTVGKYELRQSQQRLTLAHLPSLAFDANAKNRPIARCLPVARQLRSEVMTHRYIFCGDVFGCECMLV